METDVAQKLATPYSVEELGDKLLLAFDNCYVREHDVRSRITALEKVLGTRGYSKAVKTKKLVLVEWDIDEGVSVIPTEKIPGRGYIHQMSMVKKLPLDCTKSSLAEAVIEAIDQSKIYGS